jgi:hypothetical protein
MGQILKDFREKRENIVRLEMGRNKKWGRVGETRRKKQEADHDELL